MFIFAIINVVANARLIIDLWRGEMRVHKRLGNDKYRNKMESTKCVRKNYENGGIYTGGETHREGGNPIAFSMQFAY